MAYIKIILALLVWGLLFFYGGSAWLDKKREQTCMSEIEKDKPNLNVVNNRCLQTAELYMKNENYGSAAWFYLLAGEYEKNIDEVESKITDDFYMNIGHSYLLKGNYEKAKEIYSNYPWEGGEDFHYSDEGMQHDFVILPKLYKDKKENLEKGLAIWNEIYKPIAKIVEASNAYSMAKEEEDSEKEIEYLKEYIEYATPFKDKESIDFIAKKKELATLYSSNSQEEEAIVIYKELLSLYETNSSKKYEYIDTLLTLARKHMYTYDYNATIKYYKKAVDLTLESNGTEELPFMVDTIYSNIAYTYKKMNKNKSALDYYFKALKFIEERDSKEYSSLSEVYASIAKIQNLEKEYNLSIENYNRAIALKKEELKSSEEYNDYIFFDLEKLYFDKADNYTALNMKEEAKKTNKSYLDFLEYEYETHYKLISSAYDTLAQKEKDKSLALENEVKAIKYLKKSIKTEWGLRQEENNEGFYTYMNELKKYITSIDKNETKSQEKYLEYIASFRVFEEEVFLGEHNNSRVLAKSYDFVSQAYDSASDINRSKIYAQKAVEFGKQSIRDATENMEGISYSTLDGYYYHLWKIYTRLNLDEKPLIDDYLAFKEKYYTEREYEEERNTSYENMNEYFLNYKDKEKSLP